MSDTRQVIWQTQVGCVSRCVNTSQSQQASQVSATSQTGAQDQTSSTHQEVHQTQVGCPAVCLGDDSDVDAVVAAILEALEQNLPAGVPGEGTTDDVRLLLEEALRPETSAPRASHHEWSAGVIGEAGAEVAQIVRQIQVGCVTQCRGAAQDQRAAQSSRTSQPAGSVSSVFQLIWQMQIGCIAFCEDAVQTQLAIQECETIQGEQPAPPEPPSAPDAPEPPSPSDTYAPAAAVPIAAVDIARDTTAPTTPDPSPPLHQSPARAPAEPRTLGGRRQPTSGRAAPPRRSPLRRPDPAAAHSGAASALRPAARSAPRPLAVAAFSIRPQTALSGSVPMRTPAIDPPRGGAKDASEDLVTMFLAVAMLALALLASAVAIARASGGRS